jgi:type II secretory ATPase GspE/PulE/Tfp pilus assembly ATPase PilB-like protein
LHSSNNRTDSDYLTERNVLQRSVPHGAILNIDFEWPLPPHFEVITKLKPASIALESAGVLILNDGRRQVGEVIRLDPTASLLEFHPERARANTTIGFASFQSVRLTQLIELKRIALVAAADSVEVYPTSSKQKCVVHFKDGTSLVADTVGFVPRTFGLFLFIVIYGKNVVRWFIPTESMVTYQIGDQLGKMLVDEKILSEDVINAGLKKQEQLRAQKLGDYLQQHQVATQQQVESALRSQKSLPQIRLGEALIQEKIITEKQLSDALQMQSQDRKKQLGDILVEMDAVNKETIKRVLAQKLGIPFVGLTTYQFDPNLIKAVPGDLVRKHTMMPLYRTASRIVVAMENPLASEALMELAFVTKLKVDPVMASAEDLNTVITQFYGVQGTRVNISDLVSELNADPATSENLEKIEPITESDNTLVRLVNKVIMDAFETGASDIHIESMKDGRPTRVRFRKDGVMSHYSDIPANFRNALISRLKIMSRLDISEKRHSQDGKISFEQFGPAKIELRIVTMPTTEGLEDVVMRILSAPKAVSLEGLGLSPYVIAGLQKAATRPHGLLFVCGPTGSGKTTTLHALLSYINTPERKIWTVEDPIEITQEGLRQVQVQSKIDWTFATVLRSFLRADPDVIMVGETRDPETARTVIEASLTGHLVFSTMHTNSAVESVVRLLDLGLDPFNFADALLGVVGQRLARRLCTSCRTPYAASEEEINMLAHEYCFETDLLPADIIAQWGSTYKKKDGSFTLFRADGCKQCDSSGYKGRLGIHELLINSAAIKKKIHAKANVPEILNAAVSEGMRTLRQDGIDKIFQGHTDWEQIRMV